MEPEYLKSLSVFPAIQIYCADDSGWYWEDDETPERRGPYPTFTECWAEAGKWLMEEI